MAASKIGPLLTHNFCTYSSYPPAVYAATVLVFVLLLIRKISFCWFPAFSFTYYVSLESTVPLINIILRLHFMT